MQNKPTKSIKYRVLVNFKTQQVIHIEHEVPKEQWDDIRKRGFTYVGDIRLTPENELRIYWKQEYFSPSTKYQRDMSPAKLAQPLFKDDEIVNL